MKKRDGSAPEARPAEAGGSKRKIRIAAIVLGALFVFAAGWLGGYLSVGRRARSIARMADIVADNYYQDLSKDEVYDALYDGFELDKFCTHYTEEEYKSIVAQSNGNNSGLGLSLSTADSTARVFSCVYNSPAERAGLESGMYITRFGTSEDDLQTGTRQQTLEFLRSHDSCTVAVGYEKDGSDARIVSFAREDFLGSYCMYADSEGTYRFRTREGKLVLTRIGEGMDLPASAAYIRLLEFDGDADSEFTACLQKMKEAGRTDLVLDLRSNGGGYLSTLCSLSSHLLKTAEGTRPVIASAPDLKKSVIYRANGNDFSDYFSENSRFRILADENTASASEALIGAMVCYGTASYDDIYLRVGGDGIARSYGKGVMQSHFFAPDGNVLRLTVSRILWPDGTCIHDRGVREEGGAHAVTAPLLPSEEDSFLSEVILSLA